MSGPLAAMAGGKTILALSVVASNVSRSQGGPDTNGTITTKQSPNTTVSGGVPGYSYNWAYVSGSTNFTVLSATVQNPTWEGGASDGVPEVAVWRVTVTDAAGSTATADITVTLRWTQV